MKEIKTTGIEIYDMGSRANIAKSFQTNLIEDQKKW